MKNQILTIAQEEKYNLWAKTGKVNGKKIKNIFSVANEIGTSVTYLRTYELSK